MDLKPFKYYFLVAAALFLVITLLLVAVNTGTLANHAEKGVQDLWSNSKAYLVTPNVTQVIAIVLVGIFAAL